MNSRELEKNDRPIMYCEGDNSVLVKFVFHLVSYALHEFNRFKVYNIVDDLHSTVLSL